MSDCHLHLTSYISHLQFSFLQIPHPRYLPFSLSRLAVQLSDFLADLDLLAQSAPSRIAGAQTMDEWTAARTALVGRQAGAFTALMAKLGELPKEDRREAGAKANALKVSIEESLDVRKAQIAAAAASSGPALDLSMAARAR